MKRIVLSLVVSLVLFAFLAPIASAQFQLPTISVNPTSYDFGQVPIYAIASATIVVSNTGDVPLIVTAVKTKGYFSDSETSFTVAGHSTYSFQVYFAPSAPVSYSSICTILSNAHNKPVLNIPLSGFGEE